MSNMDGRWIDLKDVNLPEIINRGFESNVLDRDRWSTETGELTAEHSPSVEVEAYLLRHRTNEKIDIISNRFVVGKSKSANYKIEGNSAISREHAVFIREKDKFFVEDMGALNHTYLNGKIVTAKASISDGDTIKLADEEFLFVVTED